MKARSWIKAVATTALASPRAALRKTSSSFRRHTVAVPTTGSIGQNETIPTAHTITAIPLSMLHILTQVVDFLDKNHLQEEGLYSKPGVTLECVELLNSIRLHQLSDLAVVDPHSIAEVIKTILRDLYEPLVSAGISQQLLDAVSSGHVDDKAERVLTEIFKQIPNTTRDFLQVFLGHLNKLSTSVPAHMGVASLALHVGIALIRPTDDKTLLNSKTMVHDRKCVAEFLIRQAPSLPYDCVTEMNIPAIPELVDIDANSPPPSVLEQLRYIQVSWDATVSSFNAQQLEEMFAEFGEIESLDINDKGNRAIIAFVSARDAEAAERATTPNLHVRRRKPRRSENQGDLSQRHKPSRFPSDKGVKSEPSKDLDSGGDDSLPKDKAMFKRVSFGSIEASLSFKGEPSSAEVSQNSSNRLDEGIIVEDIENDQDSDDEFVSPAARSGMAQPQSAVEIVNEASIGHEETGDIDDTIVVDDIENDQSRYVAAFLARARLEKQVKSSGDVDDTGPLEGAKTPSPQHANSVKKEDVQMSGDITIPAPPDGPTMEVPFSKPDGETNRETNVENSLPTPTHNHTSDLQKDDSHIEIPAESQPESNLNTVAQRLIELPSVPRAGHSDQDNAVYSLAMKYEEESIPPNDERQKCTPTKSVDSVVTYQNASVSTMDSTENTLRMETLQSKLLGIEKILSTSTAALSATNVPTEFERAVLQLHQQILVMVTESLVLAGAKCGNVPSGASITTTANAEFLDFLEAQAKTQVKILEVEVRAGQELLRLHKVQYEKERLEIEEEMTTLRVGRSEMERLCSELRADLRRCRSELACHVASTASIQRDKNALEERLFVSEKQLHEKEVALLKLQTKYDDMHRVAAEAQMRVEKFKLDDAGDDEAMQGNQAAHELPVRRRSSLSTVPEGLPQTTNFFNKLSSPPTALKSTTSSPDKEDSPAPDKVSNVAVLEAMKQQMAREIREQLATTRAALHEMEICSASGKTLAEEEEELQHLQQQLAAKSSEMTAAMNESRTKLQELLAPETALSSSEANLHAGCDEVESNQESTIFDYTALVNELIARAEVAPTSTLNRQNQLEQPADDEWPSNSEVRNRLSTTGQSSREPKSVLYQKWTAERDRKIAQLKTYRDQKSALRAQQSMQTFQQTLAEFRNQR